MPDRPNAGFGGTTFHVVNRAIEGQKLYRDFGEYLSFLRLLAWTLDRVPIALFAYCLMPNHWHFLLRPAANEDLPTFMYTLSKEHALGLRRWRGNLGDGAVYKGRYRISVVHTETYFYRAARYVERNPVRANLAERTDEWLWSSASRIGMIQGVLLADWPLPRPADWNAFVNTVEPQHELDLIRRCTRKGEPIIDPLASLEIPATAATKALAVSEKD